MNQPFVRPDVAGFLTYLNAVQGPKMHEVDVGVAREMMRAMQPLAELPTGPLAVCRDITIPADHGVIPARLYDCTDARDAGPIMVFFHGGGFVIGDLGTHEPYCAEVARQLDMPVVAIDYRLAPEHRFPAAAEDCETAARWLAASPEALGLDVSGLVLSGDSAGGNLTIVTAMALRDRPAAAPVLLQHPIYPVVSSSTDWPSMAEFAQGYLLTEDSMAWFHEAYRADPHDYRGSPLDFDQRGMPPTVVTTASLDPLRDQGLAYYHRLIDDGVEVAHISADGNIHGHINLRQAIPSSQQDIANNLAAVKTMLARVGAQA
ncbi:MAG: alpha/beta hydrolase [Sphingopyxis sp.]|jgi:acetyl esterase|nr:alpha/beta hydrolase [Sphingopyxis sp.]